MRKNVKEAMSLSAKSLPSENTIYRKLIKAAFGLERETHAPMATTSNFVTLGKSYTSKRLGELKGNWYILTPAHKIKEK